MAPNYIIQCLRDFGDGFQFESLCNDIMHLHYQNYQPAGGVHDRGVDGLRVFDDDRIYFKDHKTNKNVGVFQYSLQVTWEDKVRKTLKKLNDNGIKYDIFVLVSNQAINETARTKLKIEANSQYGVDLEIFGQEFLRLYLENPDYNHLHHYFASFKEQLERFGVDVSLFANLPLAERHKRRALVLLSACAKGEHGQIVRNMTAREVIIGCVYGNGSKTPRSFDDVIEELSATLGSQGNISNELVRQIIESLVEDGRVIANKNTYSLSDGEFIKIQRMIEEIYYDNDRFYTKLLEDVNKGYVLDDLSYRTVKRVLAQSIGRIFEQKGLEVANALINPDEKLNLNDYPEINILASTSCRSLEPIGLRRAAENTIKRLFVNPEDYEAEYLFGIAESFIMYECFNLDPHGQVLELEDMRNNILVIDTDVIFQALIGKGEKSQFYRRLLQATRNLQIQMYTLPSMIQEYVYRIRKSNEDYIYMGQPLTMRSGVAIRLGEVFSVYFSNMGKEYTWIQFIKKLIGSPEGDHKYVEQVLENEFGINVKEFSVNVDPDAVKKLASAISRVREDRGKYKHEDLYKTDATIALTVDQLLSENIGKTRYWLLSGDSTLSNNWRLYTNRKAPVFPPQVWFQYISQHPTSGVAPRDFASLMNSLNQLTVGRNIPRNLIMLLIRFGVDINKYTDEALENLSDQLSVNYMWNQIAEKKPTTVNDEQLQELSRGLEEALGKIETIVSPQNIDLSERAKRAEGLVERLVSEKYELEQKVKHYEQKDRSRRRYQRQVDKGKPKKRKQ